jgi:hypothetical protein
MEGKTKNNSIMKFSDIEIAHSMLRPADKMEVRLGFRFLVKAYRHYLREAISAALLSEASHEWDAPGRESVKVDTPFNYASASQEHIEQVTSAFEALVLERGDLVEDIRIMAVWRYSEHVGFRMSFLPVKP